MAIFRWLTSSSLLIAAILFVGLVIATPNHKLDVASTPLQIRSPILEDGTLNCETERSSDYYGLGVRLGVYFAWFQAWIANVCVPSEISSALDTNAIFLFAILVSMVRCTITGLLLKMDGLLLMHMGGGTIFSVMSIWGYRTCTYDVEGPTEGVRKFGGWGTHLRLLCSMGISTYGLFFWAWGIKGALNSNEFPECQETYTFMFSKVRADGGIRIFYILVCICCMTYFGSMLLVSLVAVPTRFRLWSTEHKQGDSGQRVRHLFATGLNQKQLRQIFYFLRISNFLFIIYSMLLIEFTLNYNSVASVLGWRGHIFFPSQVIPMIIGAFGFCRVIWVRYLEWKTPDYLHSKTKRTILNSNPKELMKIYSPKSNVGMESANRRPGDEMDVLMKGQPIWLRLLVTWLPWLAVLRWWAPGQLKLNQGQHSKLNQDPESPHVTSPASGRWSDDFDPKQNNNMQYRDTWGSDDTIMNRTGTSLPEIPKNIARFGSLR